MTRLAQSTRFEAEATLEGARLQAAAILDQARLDAAEEVRAL
jgi:hypothetical protein